MELFRPALWDPILHLILYHGFVWALGKCLSQRLLMELVELVVELGDHLLYVSALFLCVHFLEDSDFHVLL